jgi:hypothetical protein
MLTFVDLAEKLKNGIGRPDAAVQRQDPAIEDAAQGLARELDLIESMLDRLAERGGRT